jgi:signal peptidase II
MQISRKARYFWPLLSVLFLTDCTTKNLIVDSLGADPVPRSLFDGVVRLTPMYNAGTAFGFDLRPYIGDGARLLMISLMVAMVLGLAHLYRRMSTRSRLAGAALGLACGGALGNLFDRLRFSAGVVDFINVGFGTHRFWVFNVADAGITVGGIMLALILSHDEKRGNVLQV